MSIYLNPNMLTIQQSYTAFDEKYALRLFRGSHIDFFDYLKSSNATNDMRYALALTLVEDAYGFISDYITKFNILEEEQRYNLAMIVAKKHPDLLHRTPWKAGIQNFNLSNEQYLIDIALQVAGTTWHHDVVFYLEQFDVQQQFIFVSALAEKHPEACGCVWRYNFTPEQLYALALSMAEKHPESLCSNLNRFKLTVDQCFVIADKIIDRDPASICRNINYFTQESERILFEERPKKRLAIAETVAETDVKALCIGMKQLHILEREIRFNLAKKVVEKGCREFCEHVKNFDLSTEQLSFLGEKLFTQNPVELCFYFDLFSENGELLFAHDEPKRLALAKLVAKKDLMVLAQSIQKLHITDCNERFELAKAFSRYYNYAMYCELLKNFKLNEDQLFTMAKITIEKDSRFFLRQVKHFDIHNTAHLFILAEMMVETNAVIFCDNFNSVVKEFKLINVHAFHLAKKLANKQSYEFCGNIVGIRASFDQKQLFELSKILIEHRPVHYLEHIQYFEIHDEQYLSNLAEILAEKIPSNFLVKAYHFKLSEEKKFQIAKMMGEKLPVILGSHIDGLNLPDIQAVARELSEQNACIFIFYALFRNQITQWTLNFSQKRFFQQLSTHSKVNETMGWNIPNENVDFIDISLIKQAIIKNHAAHSIHATHILNNFLRLFKIHPRHDLIQKSLTNNPEILADIFSIRNINLLSPLLLTFLEVTCDQAIPEGITPFALLWSTAANMRCPLRSKDLRDNLFINPLIHFLVDVKLEFEGKIDVFNWIFENPKNKAQVLIRANIIRAICNFKAKSRLVEGDYETLLRELASKILPEIQECTNEQLRKTFISSRNSAAIFTYAANIATLNDRDLLSKLGSYVREVAVGEFPNSRRDNIHLQKIAPTILAAFHQGQSKTVETTIGENVQRPHLKIQKIIQNALNDKHLRDEDLLDVSNIPQEEQNFAELGKNSIQDLESKISTTKDEKLLKYLNLQLWIMKLTNEDIDIKKYDEIVKIITPYFKKDSLFMSLDIPSISKLFIDAKEKNTTLYLYDTDNPYDLLLCGTEVEGSCQRIDGSPNLNQGLLGYLLNGQTRLLVIKENPNGPIKARAIFRLLLDQDNKPALYFERIYPQTLNDSLRKLLTSFALERGKQLGLTVYHSACTRRENTLHSFGGRASEYVDGASGIEKDAIYKISAGEM